MTACDLEVVIKEGTTSTALTNAWLYWLEGGRLQTLRVDDGAAVLAVATDRDVTLPRSYTASFTTTIGASADVFFSRGAKPIPDALVRPSLLTQRQVVLGIAAASRPAVARVTPGGAVNALQALPLGRVELALPLVFATLTAPVELSLTLMLFEPLVETPTEVDIYYRDGIPQKTAWFGQANAATLELTTIAAPAAQFRRRERHLKVAGSIAERVTGAKLALIDAAGNRIALKDANGAAVQEITATLGAAAAGKKPLSAALLPDDAGAAFGPVQLLVTSDGVTPPIVEAFFIHLIGAQVVMVDDTVANADGTRPGPVANEAQDVRVVDYLSSGHREERAVPNAEATLRTQLGNLSRQRRMQLFDIRADRERPLPGNVPVNVIQAEMPMFMAELELVGINRAQLEDLMRRRFMQLAATPNSLALSLRWKFNLEWRGPDNADLDGDAVAIPAFEQATNLEQAVTLALDTNTDPLQRKLTSVTLGSVENQPQPVIAPPNFPVAGRRAPRVRLANDDDSDLTRAWGRHAAAPVRPSIVIEWQPSVTDAGVERIRGGDGLIGLTSLTVDGTEVAPGLIVPRPTGVTPPAPGPGPAPPPPAPPIPAPPPANTPPAQAAKFRVRGLNPTAAQMDAIVDALVSDRFNQLTPNATARFLTMAEWQSATRRVVGHETGHRHFNRRVGRNDIGRIAFVRSLRVPPTAPTNTLFVYLHGKETDMPIFGAPHGYGAPQLDPPQNVEQVWDVVASLRRGVEIFMEDKAALALTDLGAAFPRPGTALDQRQKNLFLRAAVRRYNGGREFVFDATANDWFIRPSVSADRRNYPNEVLNTGTLVPYGDLGPPANLPRLTFLPVHFFL